MAHHRWKKYVHHMHSKLNEAKDILEKRQNKGSGKRLKIDDKFLDHLYSKNIYKKWEQNKSEDLKSHEKLFHDFKQKFYTFTLEPEIMNNIMDLAKNSDKMKNKIAKLIKHDNNLKIEFANIEERLNNPDEEMLEKYDPETIKSVINDEIKKYENAMKNSEKELDHYLELDEHMPEFIIKFRKYREIMMTGSESDKKAFIDSFRSDRALNEILDIYLNTHIKYMLHNRELYIITKPEHMRNLFSKTKKRLSRLSIRKKRSKIGSKNKKYSRKGSRVRTKKRSRK